jgi:hypothetical protein
VSRIVEAPPNVVGELKTLMKIGYTLETSIADIIDNSIAAKAKKIEIEIPYSTENGEPFISIKDDGKGMTEKELISNMVIGCKDPDDERETGDLGRFGSGMKTASFSQARKLTVITKSKGQKLHGAVWDIDRIIKDNKWNLEVLSTKEVLEIEHLNLSSKDESGTQIIWEKLERYSQEKDQRNNGVARILTDDINKIKDSISLLFHRYIKVEKEDKNDKKYKIKQIKVLMNDVPIEATDPYMRDFDGHEEAETTQLFMSEGTIDVKIHNIPHPSKLTAEQKSKVGGEKGYNTGQGFYIYRDKRLMIPGDWLGTHAAGVLGNRARVRVDIPSKMDHVYGTDVKKADFQFPLAFRQHLSRLGKVAKEAGKRDYVRRGRNAIDANTVWRIIQNQDEDTVSYRVKSDNDEVRDIMQRLDKEGQTRLAKFFIQLGNELPLDNILFFMANDSDKIKEYNDWEELLKESLDSVKEIENEH